MVREQYKFKNVQKQYSCTYCIKIIASRYHLNLHMRTRTVVVFYSQMHTYKYCFNVNLTWP